MSSPSLRAAGCWRSEVSEHCMDHRLCSHVCLLSATLCYARPLADVLHNTACLAVDAERIPGADSGARRAWEAWIVGFVQPAFSSDKPSPAHGAALAWQLERSRCVAALHTCWRTHDACVVFA